MTNRMFRYLDESGKEACVRLFSIIGLSVWWPPELKVPEGTVASIHLETISGSTAFSTSETVEALQERYDGIMRDGAKEDRAANSAPWDTEAGFIEMLDSLQSKEAPK